jgi:DNA recombination protein RmuC
MIELIATAVAALSIGAVAGFVVAKSIASARNAVIEGQFKEAASECDRQRQKVQDATVAQAKAESEREAAISDAARATSEEGQAKAKLGEITQELNGLKDERADLVATVRAQGEQIKAKEEELGRQKIWFDERSAQLQLLFENTANQLLEDRATKLGQQNNAQLDTLLGPFKAQLTDFRQRIDEIHTADSNARGELKGQIETLAKSALDVGSKADQLASAMLGNVKQQGEWGQLQLTVQLEKAGFVEGTHFSNQHYGENEDSERRIADTVLWLPNDNSLVIDAKVTLPSWKEFCSSETDEAKKAALSRMTASVKSHYVGLAKKDYAHVVGKGRTIPFTIMFIPIEPAGLEILRADPELFNDACRRGVIMVTPTSLFGMLQLISSLWSFHDKQKNALEIAEQGRLLLKKLNSFLDTFADVGTRITNAANTFDDAKKQLHTGRGNLISIADKMAAMGVEVPAKGELPKLMQEVGTGDEAEIISITRLPDASESTQQF